MEKFPHEYLISDYKEYIDIWFNRDFGERKVSFIFRGYDKDGKVVKCMVVRRAIGDLVDVLRDGEANLVSKIEEECYSVDYEPTGWLEE